MDSDVGLVEASLRSRFTSRQRIFWVWQHQLFWLLRYRLLVERPELWLEAR